MKCYIVKDLLPGYIDGLTGKEASTEVREHLEYCISCSRIYEQMSAHISQDISMKHKKIDFFKKLKTKMRHQYTAIALSICVMLALFAVFTNYYTVFVPFDSDHMSVKISHTAALPAPPYTTQWQDLDSLDFETTKAFLEGEYGDCDTRDFIWLQYRGFDNTTPQKYGRTIERDGEMVDVIFYCATRTLWDILFLGDRSGGSWAIVGNLNDDTIYHSGYEERRTEIYYFPANSLGQLKRLSDESFDEQRKNATLVWSGII